MYNMLVAIGVVLGVLLGLAAFFGMIVLFVRMLTRPRYVYILGEEERRPGRSDRLFIWSLWILAGAAVAVALFRFGGDIASFIAPWFTLRSVPFILKVIALTLVYAALFTLFAMFVVLPVRGERPNFHGALRVIGIEMGPDRNKKSANNRRWMTLLVMFVITLFIAVAYPGPALIEYVQGDLAAPSWARQAWYVFETGKDAPPLEPVPDPKTTWFWWKALLLYFIALVIYAFAAFGDDLIHAIKQAYKRWQERMAERRALEKAQAEAAAKAAEAQAKGGRKKGAQAPPPPPPQQVPIKRFLAWELAFDILGEFLGAFFAQRFGGRA